MAQGNINLHIGTTYNGDGFRKLDRSLKAANKSVGRFGKGMGAVMTSTQGIADIMASASNNAGTLGGTLGKVASAAAPLLSGFLSMGVWGLVIGAIGAVVGMLKKMKEATYQAKLAAKGMSEEYMTASAGAAGYAKRMAMNQKALANERERAKLVADNAAAEAKRTAEGRAQGLAVGQKIEAVERSITAERRKQAELAAKSSAIDAESASRATAGVSARTASSRFETESGERLDAIVKIADGAVDAAKAEATRAVADAKAEVDSRAAELQRITDSYGAESSAAATARKQLIDAQQSLANVTAKAAKATEVAAKNVATIIDTEVAKNAQARDAKIAAINAAAKRQADEQVRVAKVVADEQVKAAEEALIVAQKAVTKASSVGAANVTAAETKANGSLGLVEADLELKREAFRKAKSGTLLKDERRQEVVAAQLAYDRTKAEGERAVNDAKNKAQFDIASAQADLALATEKLATVRAEAALGVKAAEKAAEEQLAATEYETRRLKELADWRAAQAKAAREAVIRQQRGADELAKADADLAKARTQAARFEDEAKRARAGGDFNAFQRGEKELARQQRREGLKRANDEKRAEREVAHLQGRLFDRNGKLRGAANKQDLKRWQDLNKWLEMRKGGNPFQKAADALAKRRNALLQSTSQDVAAIKVALGNLGL